MRSAALIPPESTDAAHSVPLSPENNPPLSMMRFSDENIQ